MSYSIDFRSALENIFPSDIMTEGVAPGMAQGYLYQQEWDCVKNATSKRKQEFLSGRLCARKLLSNKGYSNHPLVMSQDKTPKWPNGIVGCISHTSAFCGVGIADSNKIYGLGLDIELIQDVTPNLWPDIMTKEELSWIRHRPENEQTKCAALLFSAKESFYKCQYPLTNKWLNFHDVNIVTDFGTKSFKVLVSDIIKKNLGIKNIIVGKYCFCHNLVFTGLTLERNA